MSRGARFPPAVRVVEVGPRDGFQMEARQIPTELKIEVIERLSRSGLAEIEAVSFVHPRVIPQMRDAAEVMHGLKRQPGVLYSALVPNVRGAERALTAGADGLLAIVSATESYNRRNVGMSVLESIEQLEQIVAVADDRVPVAATLVVSFGCPFEGQVAVAELVERSRRLAGTGIAELGLADTAGLAHPLLVRDVVAQVRDALPELPLRLHLHDTRGLGLANAMAGLEEGVAAFDAALGGLGGCPVMRGASGNLATEDFVNLCNEIGVHTGIDLEAIRSASRSIQTFLERELPSKLLATSTREELYALNRDP